MDRKKLIPFLVVGALLLAGVIGVVAYNSVQAAGPGFTNILSNMVGLNYGKGAGGASDQMARMMQAAIQKNHLLKQPLRESWPKLIYPNGLKELHPQV